MDPMSPTQSQSQAERDEEESLHYRAMARRLADMAMQMAEQVLQDASSPQEPGTDHTARFERASRTVRRAILLARKLAEPLPPPRKATAPLTRSKARERIIREVEDVIYLEHRRTPRDAETLEAELLDRLDRPDLEADFINRPIELVIADLARDLGVGYPLDDKPHVWKPRTKQDIDKLQAQAAAPLPTEPRPPRTTSPIPLPWRRRIELPDDDAQAVEVVLAMGTIRDG